MGTEAMPAEPIKILYCYAHADKAWRDQLDTYLAPVKRLGWVGSSSWHDRDIQPGGEWEKEINPYLNTADIILLIVSPNFINSDYAYGIEMRRALERHEQGKARVIPIIFRSVHWEGTPFGRLQALPTGGKPVTEWRDRNKALVKVIEGIYTVVQTLLPRKLESTITEQQAPYNTTFSAENNLVIADEMHLIQQSSKNTAAQLLQKKIEAGDFDVFLCHNVKDKPTIKKVGERLKEYGIFPWLDEWELRPGFPWQPRLEEQIEQINAAAVFVGNEGIGPWQRQELNAYLREFANRGCPVIPVLLEDAPAEPKLPLFLRGITWVDFRQHDPDPWRQLIWGITGTREYRF